MSRAGTAIVAFALSLGMHHAVAQTDELPPTERVALLAWLQAGSYKSWARESAPHKSQGPHPVQVIAHLNAALDQSLSTKAEAHPKGAAAVKELRDASGELSGWAVTVKTDADSAGGQGWFWYEILGTTERDSVVASANGVPLCFGCHSTGRDFVLIPHPLN